MLIYVLTSNYADALVSLVNICVWREWLCGMQHREMPWMDKYRETVNNSDYNYITVHYVACRLGLSKISGCLIFVGQSVHSNFRERNPNIKCGQPTLTVATSVTCAVQLTEYSSTVMVTIPHSQISRCVICNCPWVDWSIQRQQNFYNLLV